MRVEKGSFMEMQAFNDKEHRSFPHVFTLKTRADLPVTATSCCHQPLLLFTANHRKIYSLEHTNLHIFTEPIFRSLHTNAHLRWVARLHHISSICLDRYGRASTDCKAVPCKHHIQSIGHHCGVHHNHHNIEHPHAAHNMPNSAFLSYSPLNTQSFA